MSHDADLESGLHAYIAGDLDDESVAGVETYLLRNPDVATHVRTHLRHKDDIQRAAHPECREDLPPSVSQLAERLAIRLRGRRGTRRRRNWNLATAAATVFTAGWFAHAIYLPFAESPPFTTEIVRTHFLSPTNPSELLPLSEERTAKLFNRIGELTVVPDLKDFGLEPVSVQLLPSDEGLLLHVPYRAAAAAALSYFVLHDTEATELAPNILHLARA